MTIALYRPEVLAKTPRNYSLHSSFGYYGTRNDGDAGTEANSDSGRHSGRLGWKRFAKHKDRAKNKLSNSSSLSIYTKHDVELTLRLEYAQDLNSLWCWIRLCQQWVLGRLTYRPLELPAANDALALHE